jgi:hypothetical protein
MVAMERMSWPAPKSRPAAKRLVVLSTLPEVSSLPMAIISPIILLQGVGTFI